MKRLRAVIAFVIVGIIAGLSLVGFISAGHDEEVADLSPFEETLPGESSVFDMTSAGMKRSLIVSMPTQPAPEAGYPVLFMFHGWQENAALMQEYTQMDDAQAILVYPDGVERAWGGGPYAQTNENKGDETLVRDIMSRLEITYPIDSERVFAAGMSNGGGFATLLGCRVDDVIRGVASVSSANYNGIRDGCSESPIPILAIHGTADQAMQYEGGTRHGARYYSIEEARNADVDRNKCREPVSKYVTDVIERTVWQGCDAPTEFYRIDGGLHIWDGDPDDLNSSVPKNFASDTVLEFFGIERG
ncbi:MULTISPECIES: alpha/beta hydrolase family esterase [unclassified Corynebacterium]|uniref:alpha/beta hydrolase family esterase n=1 Tax=unclassified Corynebacterium TaxID=2624378 RepID=UPI0029C9CCCC|nr:MULTISPECIES: PHB depolymerase family esterase [unclassified Corynebacterium]WPF67143.1 PHB depolymerase family esterase [Corynebacterium sp. 22KM0430]WPF69631.1 PHB depolymerase family esterase [Corynebacterium sp. 21KM1197]